MRNHNDNILKTWLVNCLVKYKNSKLNKFFDKIANILNSKSCAKVLLILLFVLTFLKLLYYFNNTNSFYDSHTFYQISRNIFVDNIQDFGKINAARSYQQEFDIFRNSGFPLLFPFLMACFNAIFNLGIVSGIIINYLVVLIIFILNFKISIKATNSIICGILMNLLLINHYDFILEIHAGFSIPLSLLLYQSIVYIFLFNEKIDVKLSLIIGLLAGLNINNRFDSYLAMLSIAVLINFKNKKISIKETAIYICMLIIFLLPWIIYSKYFFNVYFASDNSRATISTIQDYIFYYFPFKVPTIFNDPLKWIKIYFCRRLPLSIFGLFLAIIYNLFYIFPIFFLKKNDFKDKKELTYSYIILILPFLTLFGTCSLSGFFWELRYFLPIFWFFSVITIFYESKNKIIFRLIIIILLILISITEAKRYSIYLNNYDYLKNKSENFLNKKEFSSLIENLDKNPTILFLYTDEITTRRISVAYEDINVMFLPTNIYENCEYLQDFINEYSFNYIYISKENFENFSFEYNNFKIKKKCNTKYYYSKIKDSKNTCVVILNPNNGLRIIPEFNPEIFYILKENFEIIPTKNKSLFKVIKKNK